MGKPTADLARQEMEKQQALAADDKPYYDGRFSRFTPANTSGVNEHTHERFNNGHKKMDPVGEPKPDLVNHPPHYNDHPSGVECITITEHMNFCIGNAMKYLWRADAKGDAIENLEKARWYIDRELARRRALT